ncbi:MAG: hypothetical protein CMN31_25385 [Sandaracinus sp.]|nr:hypothetical protein [Sandaracinus sp.]
MGAREGAADRGRSRRNSNLTSSSSSWERGAARSPADIGRSPADTGRSPADTGRSPADTGRSPADIGAFERGEGRRRCGGEIDVMSEGWRSGGGGGSGTGRVGS